jgi:hypothetical protein
VPGVAQRESRETSEGRRDSERSFVVTASWVTEYMNSGGAIEMAQRITRTYEPVDKIGAVNVKAVDLTVLLQMATRRILL